MTVSELQINCFEFRMGAWRNNGNDIVVGRGNRVRTFYILSFSGSGRYCQDQILICGLIYLFIFYWGGILFWYFQIIPSPLFSWRGEDGGLWDSDVQGGR